MRDGRGGALAVARRPADLDGSGSRLLQLNTLPPAHRHPGRRLPCPGTWCPAVMT
jgi:hypothetical protein